MNKLIEALRWELKTKRRELDVQHRIHMAVKDAKREECEYVERVIDIIEKKVKEIQKLDNNDQT